MKMNPFLMTIATAGILILPVTTMASPCDGSLLKLTNNTNEIIYADLDLNAGEKVTKAYSSQRVDPGNTFVFTLDSSENTSGDVAGTVVTTHDNEQSSVSFRFDTKQWPFQASCDPIASVVEDFSTNADTSIVMADPGWGDDNPDIIQIITK